MKGMRAILRRELREKLFSKSFIMMTLFIPLFIIGIMALQTYIMTFEDDENVVLIIASESAQLLQELKKEFAEEEYIKSGYYLLRYEHLSGISMEGSLENHKKDLSKETVTGYFYLPEKSMKDKSITYYSLNPNNRTLFSRVKDQINKVLLDLYFSDKQLSEEELAFAKKAVDIKGMRIGLDESVKEESYGNSVAAFLITFLLYMSLIMNGTNMMKSVLEEKSNRIVEVLLSSIRPIDMMAGKILGTALTGIIQMAVWLSPMMIIIGTNWFTLPSNFELQLDPMMLVYFLFNFFIALVTFLALYAAVGAMFDNDQDAQNGMWPVMMLIMIPFFIALGMQGNPGNELARIASMLPFASFIVMPARASVIDVPTWQFILSNLVGVGTLLLMFPLSAKIYRTGILMTGKKPTWGEIVKWLKYKN
ncbi:MAG: ABC transporter permease [Ignavibacteriaceae bacterium]|nr:ABC transporter permease [Ignavibacteriaceae bacterium]